MNDLPRIAHDPDAFAEFYREHVDAVQRFVARRVADPHLAADLTAEVFLAAVGAAGSYRYTRGEPRSWLFGVARNTVNGELRRSYREQRATRRIQGRRLLDDDDIARLQERIDAEAQARQLFGAVAELPDGERAVLELVALDELSLSAAAAALGIRPVTARVRLHRARIALRAALAEPSTVPQPMEAS